MTLTDRSPVALARSDLDRALALLGLLPWPVAFGQGPELTTTFTNAAWVALRPRARDLPLGAWVSDFGPAAQQALERARATGQATTAREVETVPPEGDAPLIVNLSFVPVALAGAQGDGLLALAQPVADAVLARRRADEAHQAALLAVDRLRLALRSADLGVFDWELDTGQLQGDTRFFEIFGLAPDDTLDAPAFWALVHPDDRAPVDAAIQGALDPDGDHDYVAEYRVVVGGETRWVQARGRAFFYQGRALRFLGTVLDVTDLRTAAARHAAVVAQVERAQREAHAAMAQRDDFLTLASHELRTPLASLRLGADALMRAVRAEGARTLEPRVDRLQRQLRRLEALVTDLLDVEQLGRGQITLALEPVDLASVAREVVEQLVEVAEAAGCEVTLDVQEGVVGFWDRARLEQVLGQLMGNALKYGRGAPVAVTVRREGGAALVEVRDHGIGLDAAEAERIFGRFERAVPTRHYGGFGLGLWIARQLTELLGGTIRAEGSPDHGARFTVTLPLDGDRAGPRPGP